MIIDANNSDTPQIINTDICIVGAGAAGIALAAEFANSNTSVALMESGGFAIEKKLQDLFDGQVTKGSRHPQTTLYRRRVVGGTTSVWGGRCIPYDDIDFERRDYIPFSGWPFPRTEILSYYKRANPICDAGVFDYSAASSVGLENGDMIPGFSSNVVHTDSIERFSNPTHFGRRYKHLFKTSPNISLFYHATCTAIKLQENSKAVTKLIFRNHAGRSIEINAKRYVLAMGGLETTRTLLSSNDVMPNGIGNTYDRLGRFYMCHLALTAAELRIAPNISNVIYGYEKSTDGIYCRRRISISAEAQRRHNTGNLIARLIYPNAANPDHGNGILSTLFLTRSILQPEYRGAFSFNDLLNKSEQKRIDYTAHLKNIIIDLPQTFSFSHMILRKRFLARRKLPSVILRSRTNAYPLDINVEQSPDPSSRITLTNDKDAFGARRIHVDWRTNDVDRHTIRSGLGIIRDEFHKSGCGDLVIDEDKLDNYWPVGGHHIGTARMATSPNEGVVDENCQVHGVSNLYIASSAVFPTSSHANPTLTIVALAIRLADYLKYNINQD